MVFTGINRFAHPLTLGYSNGIVYTPLTTIPVGASLPVVYPQQYTVSPYYLYATTNTGYNYNIGIPTTYWDSIVFSPAGYNVRYKGWREPLTESDGSSERSINMSGNTGLIIAAIILIIILLVIAARS